MNVSELYNLTIWIDEKIIQTGVLANYQALATALQRHTQQNGQRPALEPLKEGLFELLKIINLDELSTNQIEFLDSLKIANSVGKNGISNVNSIFESAGIDVATAYKNLKELIEDLNFGLDKSVEIYNGLKDCVLNEDYETDNEILMRVTFTGHAPMNNIKDFKKWGAIWFDIGRGIALVNDCTPEDVKIVGATTGSVVIELAVIAKIAATASAIILASLKVAEKVLDIRKKAEEVKALKLKNTSLAKDIEKEAEQEKSEGVKQIILNISGDLNINSDGEKVKVLDKAVKNLVNFIEKGGIVDFIMPDNDENIEDESTFKIEDLRMSFEEIRQLEQKLGILEHKDD